MTFGRAAGAVNAPLVELEAQRQPLLRSPALAKAWIAGSAGEEVLESRVLIPKPLGDAGGGNLGEPGVRGNLLSFVNALETSTAETDSCLRR